MGNICNHKVPIHCIAAVLANILTSMSGKLCKVCRSRDNICWQTGQDCYYFRYFGPAAAMRASVPTWRCPAAWWRRSRGRGTGRRWGGGPRPWARPSRCHVSRVTCHDAVTCHVCELVPHDTDHDTSDTGHHWPRPTGGQQLHRTPGHRWKFHPDIMLQIT